MHDVDRPGIVLKKIVIIIHTNATAEDGTANDRRDCRRDEAKMEKEEDGAGILPETTGGVSGATDDTRQAKAGMNGASSDPSRCATTCSKYSVSAKANKTLRQ